MNDNLKITCCIVYVIGIALAAPKTDDLLNGFVPCIKSDPKLGECLKTSLQNAIPYLVKGVPRLGLLSIDPFRVNSLIIDQGNGPVSIKLGVKELDVINLGTVKFNEINADMNNKNIFLDVHFKKPITLDGKYSIQGKVMVLPIVGDGKCKIMLDDVKAKIYVQFKLVERNENTFVKIENLSVKFITNRMHIKLDNLFNGDKVLGDHMNTFLNENWKDILAELQLSIEDALVAIISQEAKQVFNRVPLNQVIKD